MYKFVILILTCYLLKFFVYWNVRLTYYIHSVFVQDFVSGLVWTTRRYHSDTGSHNRLELIQGLVPSHYACNGYIFLPWFFFYIFLPWRSLLYILTVNEFVLFQGKCDPVRLQPNSHNASVWPYPRNSFSSKIISEF